MNKISRRRLITTGLAATAGVAGLAAAPTIARRYGLIPPDSGCLYGLGETLTFGAQRLLTKHSLAREFPRSLISKAPFANALAPPNEAFKRHQATGFSDWRLSVDGMVAHPGPISRLFPSTARSLRSPAKKDGLTSPNGSERPWPMCSMPSVSCRRPAMSRTTPSSPTGGKASTWPMLSTLRHSSQWE